MENPDFFIHMAEIGGVFVGFGALIAVRTGSGMSAGDISEIRWVMSAGIWTVIAALLPILVSGYGVSGHDLWLASSPIAVGLMAVLLVVNGMSAENRADRAATFEHDRRSLVKLMVAMLLMFWLPTIGLVAALVLVVLGVLPGQEEPLYLTAVGLGLATSALSFLGQVFLTADAGSGAAV